MRVHQLLGNYVKAAKITSLPTEGCGEPFPKHYSSSVLGKGWGEERRGMKKQARKAKKPFPLEEILLLKITSSS